MIAVQCEPWCVDHQACEALLADDGFVLDPAEDWCQSRVIAVEQYRVFVADRPAEEGERLQRVFVGEHEVCGLSVPDAMKLSRAIVEIAQKCRAPSEVGTARHASA